MKRTISIPVGCGSLFAALHFLVVGVPFIVNHGGGEGLLYIILVDLPLFLISRLLAPYLLDNSVAFSFWTFVVGGTLMYGCLGYALGILGARMTSRIRGSAT